MSNPKLHHYVPIFYLNRFVNDTTCFWVFDKKTKRTFQTNPYSVAAETHFYRVPEFIGTEQDPLFLEKQLSCLEAIIAQITEQWFVALQTMKPLDKLYIAPQTRRDISFYIALQFLRTAEYRDILSLFAEEHGGYKAGVSPEEKINLHARLLCEEGLLDEIATRVFYSIWIFARNSTTTPFFTSDNPVCFKTSDNKMWLKGPDALSIGTYVVFPLSPSMVLYCYEKSYWKKIEKFDCTLSPVKFSAEMVEHENSGQIFMASRFVISPTNNFEFARDFLDSIGTDRYAPHDR